MGDAQVESAEEQSGNVTYINGGADDRYCRIIDKSDPFTVFVQLLIAFLALCSLWIKRLEERPQRTFWTWFMDVFKQGLGACYAHVLNMVVASVLAKHIRGDQELKDQCAWYGLSYLIDCTFGLFMAILFLRWMDYFAKKYNWTHLKHSGVYIGPDGWKHWISQVSAWMGILTIVKLMMYFLMWFCSQPLAVMGQWLFAPLQGNIHLELLFVMILFPGILNVIYFWIADSYLKAKGDHEGAHVPETKKIVTDSKTESLLENDQQKEEYDLEQRQYIAPGQLVVGEYDLEQRQYASPDHLTVGEYDVDKRQHASPEHLVVTGETI